MVHRRSLLVLGAGAALAGRAVPGQPGEAPDPPIRRRIARDGSTVPVIGMGSWLTFDVATDAPAAMAQRQRVLQAFFDAGGGLIDSSPMYGRAERVIGELLPKVGGLAPGRLYAATKVWTPFDAAGARQHADSLALWKLPRLDLQQVHNLLNAEAHLKMLRAARERGELRHLGLTTSHGRRHDALRALMRAEPLDAIQLTYNMTDTSAEPLMLEAAERGLAVIVNRPFDAGLLPDRLAGQPLPAWARDELGVASWATLLLKWVVGHPAVSCAIPATSNPAHMRENMAAARGMLPDARQRERLLAEVRRLV